MTGQPEPAGVDLARIALNAAKQRAKAQGAATPRERRQQRTAARRRGGRDPLTLATALDRLTADRGWELPTAGGSILDQWPAIAPELVGKVAAVRFDAETRTLHLRPASPAYGTQLRMFQRQMLARIADKTGGQTVRVLRVLPPGPIPDTPSAGPGDGALEEAAPPRHTPAPRTRADAADGYHHALAAAQAHRSARTVDPAVAAAIARQNAAQAREPEHAFTDAVEATAQARRQNDGGNDAEQVRQAALQRARAEKAGRAPAIPTVFGRTA